MKNFDRILRNFAFLIQVHVGVKSITIDVI